MLDTSKSTWLLSTLLVLAGACGGDDSDDSAGSTDPSTSGADGSDTGTPVGTAEIRVIHASADAPAVDVYVAGTDSAVISALEYGAASDYLEVPAGDYAFDIRAAGADAGSEPVFTTEVFSLGEGAVISAMAAGLIGSTDDADGFRVVALAEGFADPGAGNAAVRIVHAGADAPAVDIDVGNDGSPELEGVGRFVDSGAEGVPLPAGEALQVGIWAAGERVTAFTTPELPDGGEIFVIATGLLSDLPRQNTGFSLVAVAPTGAIGFVRQNPTLYAFHGSPDAPAVDICAGGAPLLTDVPFGAMAPIQVPPGSYTLDFFGAGSDCEGDAAASVDTPQVDAGQQYFAAATGELAPEEGDPAFTVAAFAEAFSIDNPDDATVRIIHAASAPAVDAGVVDGNEIASEAILASDLAWPNESDEIVVPPDTYRVGVAAAGGTPPLAPIASFAVPATAGLRGWVTAAGALVPAQGEEPFRLFAIVTGAGPWQVVEIPPS